MTHHRQAQKSYDADGHIQRCPCCDGVDRLHVDGATLCHDCLSPLAPSAVKETLMTPQTGTECERSAQEGKP